MTAAFDFDAIIVGSGFGGSVMAQRLAAGGQRVCLLERGKAYSPDSFARTPQEMRRNLWDPSAGLHGLFDVWSFRGLEALVASGLGGGSLIYANVLLRMPEECFERADAENGYAPWPLSRAALDPHYERVERMLGATPYPYAACTPKTRALHRAAQALRGAQWELPPLAVSFASRGKLPAPDEPIAEDMPNLHGVVRYTCNGCGECDLGCRAGAKNTLDFSYLGAAQAAGAAICERCEVRDLRPLDGEGFAVRYVRHLAEREGKRTYTRGLPLERLTARRVILAAGSLGSTFLLLRSREHFPGIDPALLGSRFCGNGDLLAFAGEREGREGCGPLQPARGPVITAAVRGTRAGHYYCIEDGGIPAGAEWLLQIAAMPSRWRRVAGFVARYLAGVFGLSDDANLSAELGALFAPSRLPLLGMGRERPNGRLFLRRDRLQASWMEWRTRGFYRSLTAAMAELTRAMGADFHANPLGYLGRVITVHPLGGCPMGRSAREGVVDGFGEVFGHPGLFVVDGAAMRGPVGVNPSLTIAAFADRCADEILTRSP